MHTHTCVHACKRTRTHARAHIHTHIRRHARTPTHARTHAHTHITPRFTLVRLETFVSVRSQSQRVDEPWVATWRQAKFEHVAQRKGDCSRHRDQWKKRRFVFFTSRQSTKGAIISRGAESVWWDVQVKEVMRTSQVKTREEEQSCILFCILLATSANPEEVG